MLGAGLQNHAMITHRVNKMTTFINGEGQRFLAIDILAGLRRGEVDQGVPVIRGPIDDHVNIITCHDLPKIAVNFRGPAFDGKFYRSGGGMIGVHITDRENIAEAARVGGIGPPLTSATNEGDAESIIGPVAPRSFSRL